MNCINKYHNNLKFLGVLFFAFFICITSAVAFEPDKELFTDTAQSADISADQEKAYQDPTVVRSRYVNVNFNLLAVEKDASPESQGDDSSIVLNLFEEVTFTAIQQSVEERSSSSYTWIGWVEDATELGDVILAVEDGHMAGNITIGGEMYQIRSIGSGVHAIYEIDQSAFPDELPPIPVEGEDEEASEEADESSQGDTGSTIDVMVVYTDDARVQAGGTSSIKAQISLAISETNKSYANSGIGQRVRLVHAQEIAYAETGNMNTDLNRLTSTSDGKLDQIHTWRNTYCADMVSLWVKNGGSYCGLAWLMKSVSSSFKTKAFSVVDRGCATGYYSFGHELGHNMGAAHDRANASGSGAYSYSYGYQDPSRNWRTIMAYNCPGGCNRVKNWSNPSVFRSGVRMGVSNSADNHRTLNNTARTVANFRQSCFDRCTAQSITSPKPGSTLTTTTVTFYGGHSSGDKQHHLYVGTKKGSSNIFNKDLKTGHSATVSGLPKSGTIYVRYWTKCKTGWKYKDHTYKMNVRSACTAQSIITPKPGSTLKTRKVKFTGGHVSGDKQHMLYVGTKKGSSNIFKKDLKKGHSATVSGLPNSGKIYVRYYTRCSSGWKYKDHSYKMKVK